MSGAGKLLRGLMWAGLAVGLAACSKAEEAGETRAATGRGQDDRPNIVLIVLDTVRQNRLSAYGYERPTSPYLEGFKSEARTYTQAYSVSNWTSPAHASMFTGLYSIAHQATQENWTLDPELRTLAEILSAEGYETIGLIGNPMIGRHHQFDQGFETYFEAWRDAALKELGVSPREGEPPTVDERIALQWKRILKQRRGERPLFLFVNLIGAHTPYDSCRPFCEEWLEDPETMGPERIEPAHWTFAKYYNGEVALTEEEIAQMSDLYDAELKKVDQVVGHIIEDMDAEGMADNTLLIVTSDHGESLGDHGEVGHLFTLYDKLSRVPLMVRFPGDARFEAGTRDEGPAQLVDLFPTALEAAGVDAELYGSQGLHLGEVEARASRPTFMELYRPMQVYPTYFTGEMPEEQRRRVARFDRRLRGIVKEGFKLIEGTDGSAQLFDLVQDSGEVRNLADEPEHAARRAALSGEMAALALKYAEGARERHDEAGEAEIDTETIENLKKLGYM